MSDGAKMAEPDTYTPEDEAAARSFFLFDIGEHPEYLTGRLGARRLRAGAIFHERARRSAATSAEVLAMLHRLQWANRSEDDPSCPLCERYKGGIGHAPECPLAALIIKGNGL